MVPPSAGATVLVTFPFSDLSQVKLRPAVVLADVGKSDWILCQITSNAYSDSGAIELSANSLASGSKCGELRQAREIIYGEIGKRRPETDSGCRC
jgi:hypothetical protein